MANPIDEAKLIFINIVNMIKPNFIPDRIINQIINSIYIDYQYKKKRDATLSEANDNIDDIVQIYNILENIIVNRCTDTIDIIKIIESITNIIERRNATY
jgi:hypothetical protein